MNTMDADLLTVAEAAISLGVSVRTVRRLLSVAGYGGRTQAVERHTAKGVRVTTMLPPDLLADLRAKLHLINGRKAGAGNEGDTEAGPGAFTKASEGAPPNDATESNDATGPAEDGSLTAPAYRAMIQAQAQTIEAMRSEVVYLRGALTLAQQNLTREQTLRALPAPTLEAHPKAPGGTETGAMAQGGAEAIGTAKSPAEESPAEEKPAAGWWTRLWGGKD